MVYLRYLIMANKPRIRFRGFTEDWEQRKLDDIAKIKTGGGTPKTANPEYWSGNIPWIQSSDLVEGDIVHVNINKFINNNALKNSAAKLISRDSIALVTRVGVGKVAVINQDFTTSQDFLSLSDFDGSDIKFLAYQLYRLMQENAKVLQGTSIKGITKTELIEQSISIPSSGQEQNLISAVLSKIDSIITLHQCKLKKLNLAKKSLLQKLFPRNGSQIPGVRFKGFTDAWEQRKFLDLLDTQNGIRRGPFGSSLKKDSFVKKSDYVVYEQQNAIYDNYVTRYFISKEKYNELIRFNIQPGDFIMSGAGTIGRISMVPDGIKKGVFNQALIRFKVDKNSVNPLYFLKFMQSDMMQKQLTQANPGSAMTNLVPMDELKKWDVTIPSLEEQNKISNFINQIDESITLHQRKLERLQEVKKGLLQKMFV